MRNTNTGDEANNNFARLLDKFDLATDANSCKKLTEEAALSEPLTIRQKQAILDRCDNRIKGTYGNSKNGIVFKGA